MVPPCVSVCWSRSWALQKQLDWYANWRVDSVTFDPETAEIRLLIVTHPSAAITLQPSKLRHLYLLLLLLLLICQLEGRLQWAQGTMEFRSPKGKEKISGVVRPIGLRSKKSATSSAQLLQLTALLLTFPTIKNLPPAMQPLLKIFWHLLLAVFVHCLDVAGMDGTTISVNKAQVIKVCMSRVLTRRCRVALSGRKPENMDRVRVTSSHIISPIYCVKKTHRKTQLINSAE